MKLIILAGGKGTRLSEETILKPKPLVLVGGKPIIWHIMKHYSKFGVNEFIICLGYKGNLLKEYFANYHLLNSDIEIDTFKDNYQILKKSKDKWKIKLVDTGEDTLTGGRIKKVLKYVANDEHFALTYGDGVSNIDINKQLIFHKKHKKIATMCLVRPPGRFGAVVMNGNNVDKFITMNIQDIIDKSMDKLNKHLKDFYKESLKDDEFVIMDKIFHEQLKNVENKYDDFKKNDEIKKKVEDFITQMYDKKKDFIKK